MRYLIAALLIAVSVTTAQAEPLVDQLQDISVTIKSGRGQGSGVLFTRKVGDETVTYVWTAAHVVESQRKTRNVIVNGVQRTVVEFDDVQIVQEFKQDGRRIGEIKMEARVVRYSDADQGEDLALLEVRKRNFVSAEKTVKFYNGAIPRIGTELYHVGSLKGQFGANSLTSGIVSQIGRVLELGANGTVFDQTTVTAFPGSSGGGVFLKADGQYVGMLVRGGGEQFNFIVPVRRLRAWAESAKITWAVDHDVAMPSKAEVDKQPIEDAGVSFSPRNAKTINKNFPFLLEIK
jgi:S1-C subfamily serine protease